MIYEMSVISQYEDGSVFNCVTMETMTAEDVVNLPPTQPLPFCGGGERAVIRDLKRNAKAALKNGKTENLAPLVEW